MRALELIRCFHSIVKAPNLAEKSKWTVDDSASLYGIAHWGDDYFHISDEGHVLVSPYREAHQSIDLSALVNRLAIRGLRAPVLIRFNGILRNRIQYLDDCFAKAIGEYGYQNRYRCVFPIKVNQQSEVVRQVIDCGRSRGFGIEAGSKPELIAVVTMTDKRTPIICNGFKDDDYIRLALMAARLGRTVILVVEKASELKRVVAISRELQVRPVIGVRVKLATRGSGRWQASGGYRSKFGLTVAEVLTAVEWLQSIGMQDCFQLLHFHLGSQIGSIAKLKAAILEAARIYVDLYRRGTGLKQIDVGGGLGVDYDGSQTDTPSSMNYTVQEYANDVVYHVQSVCDEANVPHPELITESGRAIAAHHSVLIVETLGVASQGIAISASQLSELSSGPENGSEYLDISASDLEDFERPVRDLWDSYHELSSRNVLETFHDAQVALDLCMNLFSGGYLPLEQRAVAEKLYFAICHRVRDLADELSPVPRELEQLNRMLSDIYFVNFSLFQSLPDAWAIQHLFPVMPIDRLNERPSQHAVLGDITCDSDGKVDQFICHGKTRPTLQLHSLRENAPYRLGIFLVGAYQEILGDLHNLFGDTHAVHVELVEQPSANGENYVIQSVVRGDTVKEVLGYVQYEEKDLIQGLEQAIESAVQEGVINMHQAGNTMEAYESAISQYTYLVAHAKQAEQAILSGRSNQK